MESEDPKRERLVGVAGRQSAVGSILEEEREASLRFLKYLFFFFCIAHSLFCIDINFCELQFQLNSGLGLA